MEIIESEIKCVNIFISSGMNHLFKEDFDLFINIEI